MNPTDHPPNETEKQAAQAELRALLREGQASAVSDTPPAEFFATLEEYIKQRGEQ